MNKLRKIFCLTLALILLLTSVSCITVFAASTEKYSVTYDGNTKIISDIQISTRHNILGTKKLSSADYGLLKEIGYTEDEISRLSDSEIYEYLNAKKIYVICEEKAVIEPSSVTYSSVSGPGIVETNKLKIVFTIAETNSINGRKTFALKTTVHWKTSPTWRLDDIIAMGWSNNALSCGSAYSQHSMTYDRTLWMDNKIVSSVSMSAPSDKHWEINNFPNYAVTYDLPRDTIVPQYLYSNFYLTASTKVTATSDFVACSGYGHQVIAAGTPSVSVSASNVTASLKFSKQMDDYYTGIIRVFL